MSAVIEQGATRWARPSDYASPGGANADNSRAVSASGQMPNRQPVGDPMRVRKHYNVPDPNTGRPRVPLGDPRFVAPVPKKSDRWQRNSHKRTIGSDYRDELKKLKNVNRRNARVLKKGFGTGLQWRAKPALNGRLPQLYRWFLLPTLGGLIDDWLAPPVATFPDNFVPAGWVVQHACNPPGNPNAFRTQQNCGTSVNCLAGQSGNGRSLPVYIEPGERRFTLITNTTTGNGFLRYQNNKWFIRSPCTSVATTTPIWTGNDHVAHAPHPALNPNYQRQLPSVPGHNPLAPPIIRLKTEPQIGHSAKPGAKPGLDPTVEGATDPQTGLASAPPTVGRAREWVPGRSPRNHRPRGRRQPRRRERERKTLPRSAAIRIALLRGLDMISEASELVDALYEALPEATKRRWEGKAKWFEYDNVGDYSDDRGLLDNAGQYGILGADWKLQALYHNWHKVDLDKAFENIAVNSFEDALYGRAFGGASKIGAHGV